MRAFLLFLTALTAFSQETAIREDRLRADVHFLASRALEGRLSLQRGGDVAAEWVASEFAKVGLDPLPGGSYVQPVPLIEFRRDDRETFLVVRRPDGTQTYRSPAISPRFPDDLRVRGGLVFAGFGITAPEYGYDDYAGLDVKGKVVLVFDHEPQESDPRSPFMGKGNTKHAGTYVKQLNAQRHGAAAILLVAEPLRAHPSNEQRRARISSSATRDRFLPLQALADSELKIPIVTISEELCEALLKPLGKKPVDWQRAIETGLQPRSAAVAGSEIELQLVNSERRRGVTHNVAGILRGSDPRLRDEYVVFSAHHDHDGFHSGDLYGGADDNASGTAGVVELARVMRAAETRPRRSILFLVFAAEERGLLGSYQFAAHPPFPIERIKTVINFDMIGRNEAKSPQTDGLIEIAADTSNELNLIGTPFFPGYRDVVESQNREVGLRLNYKWDDDAALNIFFRSDQYPFVLQGIPAVWWFTGFHPDYHQVTDTADKINYAKMARILRLALRSGVAFANR
jgi:hypothetical protein